MPSISSTRGRWMRIVALNVVTCSVAAAVVVGIWFGVVRPRRSAPVVVHVEASVPHAEPRLGFAFDPNTQDRENCDEYSVTYTIDGDRHRITPEPAAPLGRVLVLGCSFTFGMGVKDEEAFPYLLGSVYWPRYKVVNAACMAYGTTQAYLILEDELRREPPKAVLYGWIYGHIQRNYLSRVWLEGVVSNPWFEIENDRLVYKGVVGPEAGRDDTPVLRERTAEITRRLIISMNDLCRAKGVPFFLVLLPQKGGRDETASEPILKGIAPHGVPCIDLRGIDSEYYREHPHPKPVWHRQVAEALANEPRLKALF